MEIQPPEDDESERSPMPLAEAPPEPARLRVNSSRLSNIYGSQGEDGGSDGSTAFSLPDEAPTQYSSPPSSVYSEGDLPTRSVQTSRPPLQEVHVDGHDRLRDFPTPRQLSSRPSASMQHVTTPNTTSPSFILPAISHLKTDLQESHQSLYLLQEENKSLTAECQKYEGLLRQAQDTIRQFEAEMQTKAEQWSAAVSLLESEKKVLENGTESLEEEIKSMLLVKDKLAAVIKEKEKIQRKLVAVTAESKRSSAIIESLQTENEQLDAQLKEASEQADTAESQRLALLNKVHELQGDNQQAEAKLQQKEADIAVLRQENASFKSSLSTAESKLLAESSRASHTESDLQRQLEALTADLKKSTMRNKSLETELAAFQEEAADKERNYGVIATQTDGACTDVAVQTDGDRHGIPPLILPSSSFASAHGGEMGGIAERLGRIRDATERATIMQDVRREVSRLRTEHDAEVRRLEGDHDLALRNVITDAKKELRTKTEKHKELLKNEYDAKVEALEKRHQAELEEAKEECERIVEISDETVKAAVAEVESALYQLEEERSRAQELEEKLITFDFVQEEGRRKADLSSLKEEWQTETTMLLERIRTACNTIFEDYVAKPTGVAPAAGSKSFSPSAAKRTTEYPSPLSVRDPVFLWNSPRSTLGEFNIHNGGRFFGDQNVFRRATNTAAVAETTKVPVAASNSSALALSSSNLDQTLLETEAIVMRLMSDG